MDICFGSYNIRNGRNGGIELALLAMAQENMDLGVLYEMKIIGRFYTCFLSDYNMLVLETPSNHQRGIALLLRKSPHWQIKAHKSFGPHVLSFQLVTGRKEWFIIRCYVLTGSVADTEHTTMALGH